MSETSHIEISSKVFSEIGTNLNDEKTSKFEKTASKRKSNEDRSLYDRIEKRFSRHSQKIKKEQSVLRKYDLLKKNKSLSYAYLKKIVRKTTKNQNSIQKTPKIAGPFEKHNFLSDLNINSSNLPTFNSFEQQLNIQHIIGYISAIPFLQFANYNSCNGHIKQEDIKNNEKLTFIKLEEERRLEEDEKITIKQEDSEYLTEFNKVNLSQFLQKPQNNFPKTIVVEQLNFSFLEKKEPFCIFFSIFTKLIIKNLAYVPTEKDPNFKSSDLKYYLGLILLNDIANCKRMPSKKNKIIDLFPQIYRKNQKMKNILKKIDFKIKDISLKHSMNQGEKVKSIIKQLNESIARVYLPSKDLTLIEKIINYYPKKTLRLLCLIDLKTNFFVKLMVESYNCDFNQDVLNLLQGFCHKDYTLYLRESFSNSKLFIILKTQGIKTFGIRNSQFLKEIYPFSCEVLKNQEGLYLCVLKDINVITNLSEFEIARRIAIDSANLPSDNDLFTFFEKKYKMIQSIKSSNILKVFDQAEIYERFLRIVVDIALHNGFLINSRYEVGEKLSSDDFQMKVIENLLGVK